MGIFSKDNKTSSSSAPAAPPAPSANAAPMPPAPSAAPAPAAPSENVPGLPTPPMPGASLEDIKSQVSAPAPMPEAPQNDLPAPTPEVEPLNETPSTQLATSDASLEQENQDDELDSLFDISDLDLPDEAEGESESNFESPEDSSNALEHHEEESSDDGQTHFIAHQKEINDSKPFFVTTSQFKALLEIIESVKQKTKESSERHLRLLDIKSEEDIEYENLKKDFAFIEDKLYEVDTLIFEND